METSQQQELNEISRTKLDGIVQQMQANKEPDSNIQAVVDDFKNKYGTSQQQGQDFGTASRMAKGLQNFPQTAKNLIMNNPVTQGLTSLAAMPVQLGIKASNALTGGNVPDPYANGAMGGQNITPSDQPLGKYLEQEAGNAATVGSLFLPYGKIAGFGEKILPNILPKALPSLGKIATGAATGYGIDIAGNMQQGQQNPFTPGWGTAIGAALPFVGPMANRLSKTGQIDAAANEWKEPATKPEAKYNAVRKQFEANPESPQFLAEHGYSAPRHVEDGNFNTLDSGKEIRNTAKQLSVNGLRPALEMANNSVAKTPIKNIKTMAINLAQNNRTADKADILENIKQIFDDQRPGSLNKDHPNGFNLTDMHDSKIKYAEGVYDSTKPAKNIAEKYVASAFQHTLENTAEPLGIKVGEFNKELTRYYNAADYIESLNTKKSPVSLLQSVVRGGARFAGAATAGHLGGGVVSEFAGYQIGKGIEKMLENLTAPARDMFLRNLSTAEPKVFEQVKQFLSNTEIAQATQSRLPAPSYIEMGPKKQAPSSVQLVPAKKSLIPGRIPKGQSNAGQYQTVYTSEPVTTNANPTRNSKPMR